MAGSEVQEAKKQDEVPKLPEKKLQASDKLAVEACTESILAGLQARDAAKATGKAKGKAKGQAKGVADKVLPTIVKTQPKAKGKAKGKAMVGKELPTKLPNISKPKAGTPVYYGQCTIMHGQGKWRVTTASNRRFDKAFSFKKPGSWDELVAYCMKNS